MYFVRFKGSRQKPKIEFTSNCTYNTENRTDNQTLIENDFLDEARIILNLAQRSWCFADKITEWL